MPAPPPILAFGTNLYRSVSSHTSIVIDHPQVSVILKRAKEMETVFCQGGDYEANLSTVLSCCVVKVTRSIPLLTAVKIDMRL